MKSVLVAAILSSTLWLSAGPAEAVTSLISQPLKSGAGGVVCSCVNLTKETIVANFLLLDSGLGGFSCGDQSIPPYGYLKSCPINGGNAATRTCKVSLVNGMSVSTKMLSCTLSAVDAAGNPTAVVPVNLKLQQ